RRQVHAQLVDSGRAAVPAFAVWRAAGLRQHLDGLRPDLLQIDAQAFQDARGDALAFTDQTQQQVLGADVMVSQPPRFVDGQLDDLLGARRQADLANDHAVTAAD